MSFHPPVALRILQCWWTNESSSLDLYLSWKHSWEIIHTTENHINALYAWSGGDQLLSWGNDCTRAAASLLMFMSANMATRMTFCSCHSVYKLRNRCRVPTFHPTQDARASWHCIIISMYCTIKHRFIFSYFTGRVSVIQNQNKYIIQK